MFSPEEGLCYVYSTQNNCCEFLASDGVIFQSVIKPFFKTPVFGAPLTPEFERVGRYDTTHEEFCWSNVKWSIKDWWPVLIREKKYFLQLLLKLYAIPEIVHT